MESEAVLHIPHSSFLVPFEIRESLHLSDEGLQRELLLMTDWFTDQLFTHRSRGSRGVGRVGSGHGNRLESINKVQKQSLF